MTKAVTITPVTDVPLVEPGDDLAGVLIAALDRRGQQLADRDIVVVAQKIVSKAEGRFLDLATVEPSQEAISLAAETGKDARHVEAVLLESSEVVRHKPGVIVVAHRLGHVMASAGIDHSNVAAGSSDIVLLLPRDPDASAARLKERFDAHCGADIGVIISDSVGRAWRLGTVGIALGVAGLPALVDRRGEPDLFGRNLEVTITGFADAVAAAATLVMGEAAEGVPAAIMRGLAWTGRPTTAASIVRPKAEDLFR